MARFVDEVRALAPEPGPRFEQGTVTAVAAGAAADGNALVTVSWRGVEVSVPYPASYTPVVGHTVLVVYQDKQLFVLARLIGTP